jgi:serine/threonine protein kinase
MADSLFDNRYRYDYIYPRGRSGETLRAVDTQDGDRPVVVKRPALHDAPPIRSGQEVSIVNERKALQRLSGHPTLAELVGSGQFMISGVVHQYIVVERAQGALLADMVRELAARGERLPELEMLVIIDGLLDLLAAAHGKEIVYNDVDAKHMFWDREAYRLKVIDWGNAVFLEGDEITPQGISRASDVFQVGQLLYHILTGGGRAEVPRDAGEDFALDFGDDAMRLSPRLTAIVSKATHPNSRLRYRTLNDLRKELADYRTPLQRERDTLVARVQERLSSGRSKEELHSLLHMLEPALLMDPGYPQARAAFTQIEDRLSDLEVSADLDAARIYLESGNWARAAALLDELRGRARGDTARLVKLLREWARLLENARLQPTPLAVMDAIGLVFEGDFEQAAFALQTQEAADERVRAVGLLLAERIAAHVPDVIVLQPNLYRLQVALDDLAREGQPVAEARTLFERIMNGLAELLEAKGNKRKKAAAATVDLVALRDGYRAAVDGLMQLSAMLDGALPGETMSRRIPAGVLERSANALMTLADNMHVIGKQAVTSPADARAALDSSSMIDPSSPAWDLIEKLLDGLYELLQSYQTYIPAADGSDLADWFSASARDLQPFNARLFDDMLTGMIGGLGVAAERWGQYADAAVQGGRANAVATLTDIIDHISTLSPTLAGWLNQLRGVVQGGGYVERYALHGALGRALADGWEHFDKGRLADAERLAGQAHEAARNESEQLAARRLRDLAEGARSWQERGGVTDARRTEAAQALVEQLFTAEERTARQQFTAQMPSRETYLKAMGKGLVESFGRSSSAAVRLLFFGFVLQGALDAHNDSLDTAGFWREAAGKTLPDATRHPLTRALDEFIERRRDLLEAAELLRGIDHPSRLATLDRARNALEINRQAKLLTAGVYSLRELEASARDWADGEFKAAGGKLENALRAVDEVEAAAAITLTPYRAWLMELLEGAADLHNTQRRLLAAVEEKADTPDEAVRAAHRHLVTATERQLGSAYAVTLRQWRDSYEQFLALYTDRTMRRSARLNRFNDLFRAMFIDRHPAYPLYRHWYSVTDAAPEFPAPPTDEPTPRLSEDEVLAQAETDIAAPPVRTERTGRSGIPRPLMIAVPALLLAGIAAFAALNSGGGAGGSAEGTQTAEAVALASAPTATATVATIAPLTNEAPTHTPVPATVINTLPPRPTDPPPSITPTSPPTVTVTRTPTNTPQPTETPIPSATPLPPEGVRGVQSLLALLPEVGEPAWTLEQFGLAEDGVSWRLGSGTPTGGAIIAVQAPAPLIETRFGNNASGRIISVEADLLLQTYNPTLLLDETGVFFGLLLQNAGNANESAGLQIDLADAGVVNIGQVADGANSVVTQRSLGEVRLRLRLDRNIDSGVVTTFVNGEPVGLPLTFNAPVGVLPVLYVRDGGVIVYISSWTVALR